MVRRAVPAYLLNRKSCTGSFISPDILVSQLKLRSPMTLARSFSRADIFWTLTTGTSYNITFKLLFLASSSYTVYLMLNDYKPTHDPNIDTFKVQYLFSGSAVLAILFPYKYQITEVGYIPTPSPSKKPSSLSGTETGLLACRFYGHFPSG